ncbi:hypothetical protein HS7_03530 [Sulfolobales archaeon HS-7]|nr:hypothetical protein HS7_03530 [Sulfolobales archaeon HS-7]
MSIVSDRQALQDLKTLFLYFIIMGIISIVSAFLGIASIVNFIIVFFVIRNTYLRTFQSFAQLGRNTQYVNYGYYGLLGGYGLGFIGGIFSLIAAALVFVSPFAVYAVGLVGTIFSTLGILGVIVGFILVGITIYYCTQPYGEDLLKFSGIIIAIPFLWFIGSIIGYISVDGVINRLGQYGGYQQFPPQMGQVPPPTPQYPQQPVIQPSSLNAVYQTGQGRIDSAGNAYFSLYSTVGNISITNVIIDETGTSVIPNTIYPMTLGVGPNNVTAKFGNIPNYQMGKSYQCTVSLSNGMQIKVILISS